MSKLARHVAKKLSSNYLTAEKQIEEYSQILIEKAEDAYMRYVSSGRDFNTFNSKMYDLYIFATTTDVGQEALLSIMMGRFDGPIRPAILTGDCGFIEQCLNDRKVREAYDVISKMEKKRNFEKISKEYINLDKITLFGLFQLKNKLEPDQQLNEDSCDK